MSKMNIMHGLWILAILFAFSPLKVFADHAVTDCLFGDECLKRDCVADEEEQVGVDTLTSPWDTTLTGDWGGLRTVLSESGLIFSGDVTQFYHGITNGGTSQKFLYSGHGDYTLMADGQKLGIQEGLFIKMRVEHRFGSTISDSTGAILPATLLPELPVNNSDNLYLTNLMFLQMFSENFGVFFGKIDTLDGDMNAYAHGRGKTQFMNTGFIANPLLLRTVPYSTLAAGFSIVHEEQPLLTVTVMNPTDTTKTAGFDELFAEGATITAETRLPTSFWDLPGHQVFGGSWSSRSYVSLGQDPRIITGNVPIARQSGSWGLYWNFDQTLVSDCDDHDRGWGVFGRAGLADAQTNPISWFLSFGVGGNSLLKNRKADTFGAGWYYLGTSDEIGPLLGNLHDGQAVELFYNYQVSPKLSVTPDLQVIMPGRAAVDTSLVVGIRANLVL